MKAIVHFGFIDTPLGRLRLTAVREGLTGIGFDGDRYAPPLDPAWVHDPAYPAVRRAAAQLTAYFALERRSFDLPLAPTGTKFPGRLEGDFHGSRRRDDFVRSLRAARSLAARARGAATGRNPLAIVVPYRGSSAPTVR
jgi:O6-methylguanine-DNA--protein-cysteine methyltransferase